MSVVSIDIKNHIATATLNMPEMHNPISDKAMVNALVRALEDLDADSDVRVIILTGAGRSFSSGGNINTMLPGREDSLPALEPVDTPDNYLRGIQRIPLVFERMKTPIIAAVNGPAIGAGCDLACMCDIRIANERARFSESFVKLGLIAGDGGAWLLQRTVGFSKAAEMAFTGDVLDAQSALACGLVSEVVPENELLNAARSLAERIAANPPHAVQQTKRLMMQARTNSLASVLESAAAVQALMHTTTAHQEAVESFLNNKAGRR